MAKVQGRVAKRYARALFELCPPADLEGVDNILRVLSDTWHASHDLRASLQNPAMPMKQREDVVVSVVRSQRPNDPRLENFFRVLLKNGRLDALPQISIAFKVMLDELKRMLALEITSAFALPDSEREEIQRRIQSDYGSLATINWKTNPEILGGLVIKYGDRLLDASINGSLESLKATLVA